MDLNDLKQQAAEAWAAAEAQPDNEPGRLLRALYERQAAGLDLIIQQEEDRQDVAPPGRVD